jgi:hypothetical protein
MIKKNLVVIIFFLVTAGLHPQSRIDFTVDSPLVGPVKPKYQMIDYSIPIESASVIDGAYRGFQFVFSEDRSLQEYYKFVIELPEIEKLKFEEVEVRKVSGYSQKIDVYCDTAQTFTDKVFSEVYSEKPESYIHPKVNLEKYTRKENDSFIVEYVEFKSFNIKISKFQSASKDRKNYLNMNAVITGKVYFSSDVRYDAPYELNAVIELKEEILGMMLTD